MLSSEMLKTSVRVKAIGAAAETLVETGTVQVVEDVSVLLIRFRSRL